MNVIQPYISASLKQTLNDIYQTLAPHFESSNTNLINHKLFYCNQWDASRNKHTYLLDMLRNECDRLRILMEENTLLQINYICAPPDCTDQLFHIDYLGDSISIFIPLVDLSDLNGTEYMYFYDEKNYLLFFDLMLEMSDKYFTKNEAIEYMTSKGFIYETDYCFKCANACAYSIIEMPYYVYHRGQKNKTNHNRIMLNILFSRNNAYEYPIDEVIEDSEVDEKQRYDTILDKRKDKNIN
jgi:ferredoxin